MMMAEKFLNYSGTYLLWQKITTLLDKKLEQVENLDDSITVTDKNKIAVKISPSEGNILQLESNKGLCVYPPKLKTLTFGAGQKYKYDGSKDVTVPVYLGDYE